MPARGRRAAAQTSEGFEGNPEPRKVLLKVCEKGEPRRVASRKEFLIQLLPPGAMALGSWAPFLVLALAAAQPQLEDRLRAAMAPRSMPKAPTWAWALLVSAVRILD